ncbi:MAG: hypothetical protein K0U68_09870 [Gammaproteobacteria bacterium]|nr:hypothetical protein [Gammaproteobacteria bacterium]
MRIGSIVPPQRKRTFRFRSEQEIRHDALCGVIIGVVVCISGWWVTGRFVLLAALPLCILFCVLFGLLLGSTNEYGNYSKLFPWIIR